MSFNTSELVKLVELRDKAQAKGDSKVVEIINQRLKNLQTNFRGNSEQRDRFESR